MDGSRVEGVWSVGVCAEEGREGAVLFLPAGQFFLARALRPALSMIIKSSGLGTLL